MKLIPLAALLLPTLPLSAQFEFELVRHYNNTDEYTCLAQTATGSWLVGGTTVASNSTYSLFVEVSPSGEVLTERVLPAFHATRQLLPMGNERIVGAQRVQSSAGGEYNSLIQVSGLDTEGNGLWHKNIEITTGYAAKISGFFPLSDTVFVLCSNTHLYRIHAGDGTILSEQYLHPPYGQMTLASVLPHNSGYKAVVVPEPNPEQSLLLSLDMDLTVTSERLVPNGELFRGTGGRWYLLATSFPDFGIQYTVYALDDDGGVLWENSSITAYEFQTRFSGVYEIGKEVWVPGNIVHKPTVMRFDKNSGNRLSNLPLGAYAQRRGTIEALAPMNDDKVWLAGRLYDLPLTSAATDALLLLWNSTMTNTGTPEKEHLSPAYPNPATDRIWLPAPYPGEAVVRVYDYTGRLVLQQLLVPEKQHILLETHNLLPGCYTYQLQTGARNLSGKFVALTQRQ